LLKMSQDMEAATAAAAQAKQDEEYLD